MNMSTFDRSSSSSSSSTRVTWFVAVSRESKESESVLRWALDNLKDLGGTEICILHVHRPDKFVNTGMARLPIASANERQINSHRAIEREKLSEKLDKYLQICLQRRVNTRKIYVEMDSVEEGIVKLLNENEVGKLVMGAASVRTNIMYVTQLRNFPVSKVGKPEVVTRHEKERNGMLEPLDEYMKLCATAGVNAQKLFIEADTIENGIITLISQNMIGRLVMGAAADNRYRWGMSQLKSKKSLYVMSHAPAFCHIWFVCKGNLILTREGVKPANPDQESGEMNFSISQSRTKTELSDNKSDIYQDKYKSRLVNDGGNNHDIDGCSTPSKSNGSSPKSEWFSRIGLSDSARPSTSSEVVRGSPLSHGRRRESAFADSPPEEEYFADSSPPHLLGRSLGNELYDKLEKLMAEVDTLRAEAYSESMKCGKAEKETIEATRKARITQTLYYEEQKRRTELEEKLAKEKKELGILSNQHTEVLEEFRAVVLQKSILESEFEKSNLLVEKLDEKIVSAVDLLEKYNKERDDLEIELDNALLETDLLMKQLAQYDPTAPRVSQLRLANELSFAPLVHTLLFEDQSMIMT